MSYVAAKPFKVQRASDGQMEIRHPGQPVPEAEGWANPALWVKRGFLTITDPLVAQNSGYCRAKLQPMRSATPEDIARGQNAPVPQAGKELPGYQGTGNVDPANEGDGDSYDDRLKELSTKLSRTDLDDLATEQGIPDAKGMGNKGDVAKAILAAQGHAPAE